MQWTKNLRSTPVDRVWFPSCGSRAGSQVFCAACGLNSSPPCHRQLPSSGRMARSTQPPRSRRATRIRGPVVPSRSTPLNYRPWQVRVLRRRSGSLVGRTRMLRRSLQGDHRRQRDCDHRATKQDLSRRTTRVRLRSKTTDPATSEGLIPSAGRMQTTGLGVRNHVLRPGNQDKWRHRGPRTTRFDKPLHSNGGGCFTLSDEQPPVAKERG